MDPIPVELHDGEYHLLLRLDQIRALQDALGVGFGTLYKRSFTHDFMVDDLVEIVRLGLLGGGNDGVTPAVAKRKAVAAVDGGMPLGDIYQIAVSVLQASYAGYKKPAEDTRVGEKEKPTTDSFRFDIMAAIDFGRRLGYTPEQVRTMAVADYVALVSGWNAEHDDEVPPPAVDDHEEWLRTVGNKPDEKVAA